MTSVFARKYYGYIVFAVLIFLPVPIWVLGTDGGELVSSASRSVSALGKAAALMGLAAYSLMPVLSMRHKVLEIAFGGLDTLYRIHSKLGRIVFYLILAHPIFLALGALIRGVNVLNSWNWTSMLIVSGLIALAGVALLTFAAIYAKIKHQKWIIIHRFFGYLMPVLFFHALIARSQMVKNPVLFAYLITLGALGLCAFLYRSVFSELLIKKYRYTVAEVHRLTPMVTELVLKPAGVPLNYQPGQFAFVTLESDAVSKEAHPFSFTTANNGPYIRFAVKNLGDNTARFSQIKPGTKAYLEGPYGTFTYRNSRNKNQIWIAGGVGITPFLSMARSLSPHNDYKIHIFYAAEEFGDAVFLEELFAVRKQLPDTFDVTIVNRQISGFVTIDMLKEHLDDLHMYDYFICGPPAMMNILKGGLLKSNVPQKQIFTEEFSI